MKNIIFAILAVLGAYSLSFGAAYLPNTSVQVFTPDGRASVAITAKSTTEDLTERRVWKIRSSTACIFRALPTSAKSTYPAIPIQADVPEVNGVHISSPFLNYSGCVGTREVM